MWLDAEGRRGWAVGASGVVLSLTQAEAGNVVIDADAVNFAGVARIQFEGSVPLKVRLSILDHDGATLVPDDPHFFTIRQRAGESRQYEVHFESKARETAAGHAGQPFQLRVAADFGDAYAPTEVVFVSNQYVKGSYWLLPYIYGVGALLLINVTLVAAAVLSNSARRMALDPTIRTLVGVGIFRYLLTEPLLVYVPAVRKALFRDYRQHLRGHPQLARWDENEYIMPMISSRLLGLAPPQADLDRNKRNREMATGEGAALEAGAECPIGRVLDAMLAESNARGLVFLIEGQSGLGKSAFLQQVARAALLRGMTPLLLPLGSESAPDQEVATLMSEYGDMNVSASMAMDIVDGGGFIILMDALNEDRHPQETLRFIRKARKRNLLLLSSQVSPSFPQTIPIEYLNLAPFGRAQLERVLPAGWLDRVLEASYLAPIAGLPITALLLGAYISRHSCLPASDFAIYSSLSDGLNENEVLNLEQVAWALFTENGQQLKSDDRLTEEFCEYAVRKNVLTRRSVGKDVVYRFLHERVHRFFVARYLRRQDERALSKWHEKLVPGLGKMYWADVIEFLAATYALSEQTIGVRTHEYVSFLQEAAEFAPRAFSDRLYVQYQRYRDAGVVSPDPNFQDWAASFLSELVSGKRAA
jgi:hypothetical protein